MDVRVLASTCPDYQLPVEEAKIFAGQSAGICYMKDDFDTIAKEPEEKSLKRFAQTAGSGHHSVAGHTSYNLLLSGVPKIIAMILNNEKDYCTSEKSARYTQMALSGDEERLYAKWLDLFQVAITAVYPQIDEKVRLKLAQENARYFISVFTPSTIMEYTVDFRQGNYLIGFLEEYAGYCEIADSDSFWRKLTPWLLETAKVLRSVMNCEQMRDRKGRTLSLFASRRRSEYFGEVYSVNYTGSFAQLAQAQRHRSIDYEMTVVEPHRAGFFVPPIIRGTQWEREYLSDMRAVKENYPQGMLVGINERGTPENFLMSKCSERLCGAAQLEICQQTKATLDRYISAVVENGETEVFKMLYPIKDKTKCQFTEQICYRPCPLGQEHAFDRKI
ncbi:FAD-dependent thymidylate synthase [Candidatus Saccharibacteria bacterium]|nr:FAD-dependent thymidylate synthase [Candidatus Saccharibacteria bacterium]